MQQSTAHLQQSLFFMLVFYFSKDYINCALQIIAHQERLMELLTAKNFFFDRMLPVRLFYTRCSEVAAWHSHEFSEIAIILSGAADYQTDFSTAKISAGDVLVMPAGGSHRFTDEVDIEQFNVLFQFEKLPIPGRDITRHPGFSALFRLNPEYCRKTGHYPRFRIENEQVMERVRFMLTNAYRDQESKSPGYPLSVYGTFLQLIPILLENYCRTASEKNLTCSPEHLADCLDFMQRNFRKELSTARLAAEARMAPASFVRHFRAATGCGPQEYLIKMRLDEACILLQNLELSISEAALQSGFDDSNYFSRLFKRKNGISPREYRSLLKR